MKSKYWPVAEGRRKIVAEVHRCLQVGAKARAQPKGDDSATLSIAWTIHWSCNTHQRVCYNIWRYMAIGLVRPSGMLQHVAFGRRIGVVRLKRRELCKKRFCLTRTLLYGLITKLCKLFKREKCKQCEAVRWRRAVQRGSFLFSRHLNGGTKGECK